MDNLEQLSKLAEQSFQNKKYKETYKYCSRFLGHNCDSGEIFLLKGKAASKIICLDDDITAEEIEFCILQGLALSPLTTTEKLSCYLLCACDESLKKLDEELKNKIVAFNQMPMSPGGSALLHRVIQMGNKNNVAKSLANKKFNVIKLLKTVCFIDKTKQNFDKSISTIDSFYQYSYEYGDFLKEENDLKIELQKLRSSLVKEALSLGFGQYPSSPTKKSSTGCFIATAATGSYDNEKVVILREFRDRILLKNKYGLIAVKVYYFASPPIASIIAKSVFLKKTTLFLVVNPLVKMSLYFTKK